MKWSRTKVFWLIALFCIAVVVVTFLVNPARRPQEAIRAEALRNTPVGSSIPDVQQAIKTHYGREVKPLHRDYEKRYYYISLKYGWCFTSDFPFVADVLIHWDFDTKHKLESVSVEYFIDGP